MSREGYDLLSSFGAFSDHLSEGIDIFTDSTGGRPSQVRRFNVAGFTLEGSERLRLANRGVHTITHSEWFDCNLPFADFHRGRLARIGHNTTRWRHGRLIREVLFSVS